MPLPSLVELGDIYFVAVQWKSIVSLYLSVVCILVYSEVLGLQEGIWNDIGLQSEGDLRNQPFQHLHFLKRQRGLRWKLQSEGATGLGSQALGLLPIYPLSTR